MYDATCESESPTLAATFSSRSGSERDRLNLNRQTTGEGAHRHLDGRAVLAVPRAVERSRGGVAVGERVRALGRISLREHLRDRVGAPPVGGIGAVAVLP